MQRLYLGLDAAQVAEPERLRGQLRVLLSAARDQGFEVLHRMDINSIKVRKFQVLHLR